MVARLHLARATSSNNCTFGSEKRNLKKVIQKFVVQLTLNTVNKKSFFLAVATVCMIIHIFSTLHNR